MPGQLSPSQVANTRRAAASVSGWVSANHSTRQMSRSSWTTRMTASGVRYTGDRHTGARERVAVVDLGELLAPHPVTAVRH